MQCIPQSWFIEKVFKETKNTERSVVFILLCFLYSGKNVCSVFFFSITDMQRMNGGLCVDS